jgi:hypothetical protein
VAAFFIGRGAALGPTATAPPASTTVPVEAPEAGRPLPVAVVPSAIPTASSPAPAASAAPAVERATLVLLGDGTNVSLDGVGRGATPVHVAVEPGAHSVVFRFSATGESKAASLSLKPGERATLRADFTGASPSVRIDR